MTTFGKTWTQKPKRPTVGCREGATMKTAIRLPPEMFERVSRLAFASNLSFTEQVRRLLARALKARPL